MNGPTVLKILRKFKHHMIHQRWKYLKEMKINNNQGYNYNWYWEYSDDYGDLLCIKIHFINYNNWTENKRYEYIYNIHLSKDVAYISYRNNNRYSSEYRPTFSIKENYDDLESALFQQSLLSSPGMISSQEISVILQLKDIYFPQEK